MENKNKYLAFLAFLSLLGFMGFKNPLFFFYFFFLFFLFYLAPFSKNNGSSDLIQKQGQEKAEHLQKIKDFMASKDKVTNNDVQELLGVSDATAERYLNELEKQGILRQKGENKGIFYEKLS